MGKRVILILFLALLADQALKFWVKTSMYYGEEFSIIGSWFRFHFIENEGMAFGMAYGGTTGKILLTLFRIAAVIFISYYLHRIIRRKAHPGFIISMALILAGALGNIIDSVFYGVLFSDSTWGSGLKAEFLPEGGGYAPLLQGKVVDMFYFPLVRGFWPEWVPMVGGNEFLFFRPVFNLADSYITVGVFIIVLFQKRFFPQKSKAAPEIEQLNKDTAS